MKPHPRIRKTIKWAGVAVTVLLVAVWIGSGWKAIAWRGSGGGYARLSSGEVQIGAARSNSDLDHAVLAIRLIDAWRGDGASFWTNTQFGWLLSMPVWPVACACVAITGVAWRLDTLANRRERAGKCPKCGYDRQGLAPEAICPECGTTARSAT
jgi:hypothetical protein